MIGYCKTQIVLLAALKHDRRAVTAMEYGLIAALVAVVVIGGLTSVGTHLSAKFNSIASALN